MTYCFTHCVSHSGLVPSVVFSAYFSAPWFGPLTPVSQGTSHGTHSCDCVFLTSTDARVLAYGSRASSAPSWARRADHRVLTCNLLCHDDGPSDGPCDKESSLIGVGDLWSSSQTERNMSSLPTHPFRSTCSTIASASPLTIAQGRSSCQFSGSNLHQISVGDSSFHTMSPLCSLRLCRVLLLDGSHHPPPLLDPPRSIGRIHVRLSTIRRHLLRLLLQGSVHIVINLDVALQLLLSSLTCSNITIILWPT